LRRPLPHERDRLLDWVGQHFSPGWRSEVASAFGEPPARCWIALDEQQQIAGFACYNVTFRGFFGPTGVAKTHRGVGLGTALLVRSLYSMREDGHAYAIIGGASSIEYYTRVVDAIEIPDSTPGAYPIAFATED